MKSANHAHSEILKEILFKRAYGRKNAIKICALARELGVKCDRDIQDYVEDLRASGVPVCSAVTKPFGLYIPARPEEAKEFYYQIQSRIVGNARTKRLIRLGVKRMFSQEQDGKPTQLSLGIMLEAEAISE